MEFLTELADNNDRDWFQAHKQEYLDHIIGPAQAFVAEFGARLQDDVSPGFVADTRTNGSGSIMRIYRDIRFKKDKSPYNTQVRMIFWEGRGKKTESPGIYFCFDPDGGKIYSGMHIFPKPTLEIFRDAVIDEEMGPGLEHALAKIVNAGGVGKGGGRIGSSIGGGIGSGTGPNEAAGAYEIGGEQYKRIPREYDPMHDRAYLLKYKGLWAGAPAITPTQLQSPKLVDICLDHCVNMAPLHHWLVKLDAIVKDFE